MGKWESDLDERKRQDREKAESIRARQIRLGHISVTEEKEEKPKSKSRSTSKKAEESQEE